MEEKKIIKIIDSGEARYCLEANFEVLGRMWDNEAEEVVVVKPERERDHACIMIVTVDGKPIEHIVVGDEPVKITNLLSRHNSVDIGFTFGGVDGYAKNTEVEKFYFLKAQKPEDFVPVEPENKENLDLLIAKGFVDAKLANNELLFYGIKGQVVSRVDLSTLAGGGGIGKESDPTVPEFVKNITEDDISNWNNKSNFSGSYNDLKDKPTNNATTDYVDSAITNKADKSELESVELNAQKQIILGADGVLEGDVYNFTVKNAETFIPYRTNNTRFLMDLHLPIVGDLDKSKKYVITFGDTVYYGYSILKGQEHSTIGDLNQVDKYSNEVGYRFITEMTFFDNSEFKGFAIIPTISMSDVLALTSDEMDNYIAEGGLSQGQLAVCKKVITNGYTEGSLYRFDITYPNIYSWTELTTYEGKPTTNTLTLTGTSVLTSVEKFNNHVQIMVEFETDGIHAGFDCVLHPYDEAVCFVTYDVLVNGTPNFGTAYLNDVGNVVINIPNGLTFSNIHAKYLSYGVSVEKTLLDDGSYSLNINTGV